MAMSKPDDEKREDLDWKSVDPEMARQILALGQAHLEAQLKTALAGDARATAMAGLYVTLALAVIAAALGYWQTADSLEALLAGIASAAVLLIAAAQAGWAARPVGFFLPGTPPATWFKDRRKDLMETIGGQAEIDDRDIRRNATRMAEGGRAIKRAFYLSLSAPIVAPAVWLITACASK
jgi:hypothetical protein